VTLVILPSTAGPVVLPLLMSFDDLLYFAMHRRQMLSEVEPYTVYTDASMGKGVVERSAKLDGSGKQVSELC